MQLVTTEEASKMLAVAERTLLYWRKNNQGPSYVKLNGSIRYKLTDIESWIDQNTCKANAKQSQSVCNANAVQMQSNCNANAEQLLCIQNQNQNQIDLESSLRSLSASNADARAEDPTPTPPARSFGQTPEQQADRNGPPTKERFLEYAQGNAGWIALGLTAAQWEEIWLYGVGIEWRMPSGQMISDWKHWGIAQGRKAKNNPRPQPKPAAQGFGSTPYGSGREEILRQMRESQAKREAANAAATAI